MVQGSYVGQGSSKLLFLPRLIYSTDNPWTARAKMGGPFGNRGSNESREQTMANGMTDLAVPFYHYISWSIQSESKDPKFSFRHASF
jgi:hypothetical protein